MKKIRALVVDDSAFMRKLVSDFLSADPDIEVIDTARNGKDGVAKAKSLSPDVVTMDIEMPEMSGLEALELLMREHPVSVVMLSSLTQEGAEATFKALELGAVDFVPKPSGSISLDLYKVRDQLIEKVKLAAKAKLNRLPVQPLHNHPAAGNIDKNIHRHIDKYSNRNGNRRTAVPSIEPAPVHPIQSQQTTTSPRESLGITNLIVVGTSTGGPKALQILLTSIPEDLPAAMLIVQHMPPGFTKSLSKRLDTLSALRVMEAEDGMVLKNGCAYIAPGDFHMEVTKRNDGQLAISLNKQEPKSGHRPSVDVLFDSAAKVNHPSTYAVIMTGMGKDGTLGLQALDQTGCKQIIAEDESTCVVFGMPRSAILTGCVDYVLPLSQIGPHLVKAMRS